jgi:hypothetical protein
MNCPACAVKRLHKRADWEMHPYAGHGFNGQAWTHPDLNPATPIKKTAPTLHLGKLEVKV